ncbi:hypothetical protein ACA910_013787 [Epithemia clementina (nom. ined.)]
MAPVSTTRAAVSVTITSDLMCPWCYVGLRKLQQASKMAQVETKITWKPFFLRPNLPEQGVPKGGTPSSRVGDRLKRAGESVGIDFTGLTDRTPNTTLFHAILHDLQSTSKNNKDDDDNQQLPTAFQEAVFDAYFTRGIYPDETGLLQCAQQVGVAESVAELLSNEDKLSQLRHVVHQEAAQASKRGINGVPFFEFNEEPAFSGAQEVATFVTYLERYAALES